MLPRRTFLRRAAAMAAVLGLDPARLLRPADPSVAHFPGSLDRARFTGGHMLATWNHGLASNEEGGAKCRAGGTALDAVVEGTAVVESDPTGSSVGLGGRPDRDGKVTLDACVMNAAGDAGGVCFLEDIEHPVRVARAVMEDTPHVLLAGQGARDFAIAKGFKTRDLLTEDSRKAWEDWKKSAEYKPIINIENHDTIGMIAQDLEGGCRRLHHQRPGLQTARPGGRQPHHWRRSLRGRCRGRLHGHRTGRSRDETLGPFSWWS